MHIELTKIQYKILKSFQHYRLDKVNYSAELIAKDTKLSIYIIKENLPFLLDNELIDLDPFEKETNYFRITNKGKSLLLNQQAETKDKIIWSILVPLVTAIVGSLITNLLIPK